MIAPGIKRGTAELAVLSVLEDRPLHGYEMARRIEQQTKGALRFTLASLYPLLYRLEKRGWVRAGPFTPEVALLYPNALRELHIEFREAGAEVLQALERAGLRTAGMDPDNSSLIA